MPRARPCRGNDLCDREPRFRANIDATAGGRHVRASAKMCAEHLGNCVHALAAWGRSQGLQGRVTVFAINHPAASQPHTAPAAEGFAFAVIELTAASEAVPRVAPLLGLPGQRTARCRYLLRWFPILLGGSHPYPPRPMPKDSPAPGCTRAASPDPPSSPCKPCWRKYPKSPRSGLSSLTTTRAASSP